MKARQRRKKDRKKSGGGARRQWPAPIRSAANALATLPPDDQDAFVEVILDQCRAANISRWASEQARRGAPLAENDWEIDDVVRSIRRLSPSERTKLAIRLAEFLANRNRLTVNFDQPVQLLRRDGSVFVEAK
jgi:hypothetical protein